MKRDSIYSKSHRTIRNKLGDNLECFICKMSEKEHKEKYTKKLSLHCFDKNYENLDKENWAPFCIKCHMGVEKLYNNSLDRYIHAIITVEHYDKVDKYCKDNKMTVSKFFRVLIDKFFQSN
jgi:hypothetical protein